MSLRRVADELIVAFRSIDDVGKSWVVGGEQRRVSIYADPARLAVHGVTLNEIVQVLAETNVNLNVGSFERGNREILLEAGPYFHSATEIAAVVIKSKNNRPVFLRDVARVVDGPANVNHYTRIGFGPAVENMVTVGKVTSIHPQAGQEWYGYVILKRPFSSSEVMARAGGGSAGRVQTAIHRHDGRVFKLPPGGGCC